MYPLPDNNFNRIAIALMMGAVKIDSIRVDSPRPDGRNLFYSSPHGFTGTSTYYMRRQRLVDGRVLDVDFRDLLFSDEPPEGWHTLEIKLEPSKTNPFGFDTEERCLTPIGKMEGLYSGLLPHIGKNPILKVFRQYDDNSGTHYDLERRKKVIVDKTEKSQAPDEVITTQEFAVVLSRYQRLTVQVLAVLQGKAENITVS